jgi:hypothetical protein
LARPIIVIAMLFPKSRKGSENIDTRFLFAIFIFIGFFIFAGGLLYSSFPDETLGVNNLSKPEFTLNPNSSALDFGNYAVNSVKSMGSANPAIFLIIVVPTIAVTTYIAIRLIKPFG